MLLVAVVVSAVLVVASARITALVAVVAIALAIHPFIGVATVGCGVALHHLQRIRASRIGERDVDSDSVLAVELVGLGVTAGLPFRNAASMTADQIRGPVGAEIAGGLRSVGAGHTPHLSTPAIQSMFSLAESAERTGVPLASQLNAAATDRRRAAAAVAREGLAKLPVKMLFPLTFLILPGFVLLTVVPPLMSGLSRLGL